MIVPAERSIQLLGAERALPVGCRRRRPTDHELHAAAQNVLTYYPPDAPIDVNRTLERIVPQDLAARLDPGLTSFRGCSETRRCRC